MRFLRNNRTFFRIFGFPIRIHPSWLLLVGLIVYSLAGRDGVFRSLLDGQPVSEVTYWVLGVLGALGLFSSLIAHELCHSLVARRTGIPVRGITLFIFGGVSELGDMPATPASEFFMAVVGPLSSLAIGGLFAVLWMVGRLLGLPAAVRALLGYLVLVNGMLALFNSIPAFPLDGGRIVRSVLWGVSGNLRAATRTAAWIGSAFGILLIAGGMMFIFIGGTIAGVWLVFIGFFLGQAARGSLQRTIMREDLIGEHVGHFMQPRPVTVRPDLSLRGFVDEYVLPYHFAMFPVVDEEGRLIGVIGSRDPARWSRAGWDAITVGDVMSEADRAFVLSPETPAPEAFARLAGEQGRRLIVVANNRPVGIVSLRDLLDFLALKAELGIR